MVEIMYKLQTSCKTLSSKKSQTWRLRKLQNNDKLLWKKSLPVITLNKKHSSKQVVQITYRLQGFSQLLFLEFCQSFLFSQSKKRVVYFICRCILCISKYKRLNKRCLWEVNSVFYMVIFGLIWESVNLIWKTAV